MKKELIKLTLAIGIFSMPMISQAQTEGHKPQKKRPEPKELIKKMDANEDGKLSNDEVKGPLKENFQKVDSNKDGYITEEELIAAKKDRKENRPPRDNKNEAQ